MCTQVLGGGRGWGNAQLSRGLPGVPGSPFPSPFPLQDSYRLSSETQQARSGMPEAGDGGVAPTAPTSAVVGDGTTGAGAGAAASPAVAVAAQAGGATAAAVDSGAVAPAGLPVGASDAGTPPLHTDVMGPGGSSTDSFVMVHDDDPDAFATALEAALNDEGADLLGDGVGGDDDALGTHHRACAGWHSQLPSVSVGWVQPRESILPLPLCVRVCVFLCVCVLLAWESLCADPDLQRRIEEELEGLSA